MGCSLAAPPAVAPSWGHGESADQQSVLDRTTVWTDGKSHFLVVAPQSIPGDPTRAHALYWGNAERLWEVPRAPGQLGDFMFFEPRFPRRAAEPGWGVDLRVYSEAKLDARAGTCAVRCGDREVALRRVEAEKGRSLLRTVRVEGTPREFTPHALLRDETGRYYFVDRGYGPQDEKRFRLFLGPKGSLKLQKMTNVVADSEGEIFSTADGELRLVLDRVRPSHWIERQNRVELRAIPVEENLPLIYNELGVYAGIRLGTPCDDL